MGIKFSNVMHKIKCKKKSTKKPQMEWKRTNLENQNSI